jgi:ABC-type sugar transport system ATPase subunit
VSAAKGQGGSVPEGTLGTVTPAPAATSAPLILEAVHIAKSFGAVKALLDASLSVSAGEVLGLVGDNGAGKSTLVHCLSGRLQPDEGRVLLGGHDVHFHSPHVARAAGVEVVHQTLALVNTLDVATNLFLGREIVAGPRWLHWLGVLRIGSMRQATVGVLEDIGVSIRSSSAEVQDLSGGQRQGVAVGRAVAWGQRVVLMDEPEAALGVEQARRVLQLTRRLAAKGVAVVLISHNMQHVMEVCDRVVVLRHGSTVADVKVADVTGEMLVSYITGALTMRPSQ